MALRLAASDASVCICIHSRIFSSVRRTMPYLQDLLFTSEEPAQSLRCEGMRINVGPNRRDSIPSPILETEASASPRPLCAVFHLLSRSLTHSIIGETLRAEYSGRKSSYLRSKSFDEDFETVGRSALGGREAYIALALVETLVAVSLGGKARTIGIIYSARMFLGGRCKSEALRFTLKMCLTARCGG